jgi:triacylglycerol esterase/lipase EstA (alpha/beta hydrolase family)
MNSSPSTWNDFVASQFSNSNNKGVIRGGVLVNAKPVANSKGIYCYAVEFGFYDVSGGRTGLEGVSAANATLPTAGDFSDFAALGHEVQDAITYLLTAHPSAQITVLAHSRGGIATRAFLQNPASANKASVISVLTTGSPHKGSRLGRIYDFLAANPRSTNPSDWSIVDKLVSQFSFDVRRPVIDDLADLSDSVLSLNDAVGSLPFAISFGNLRYTTTDLGYLGRQWGISYSVFLGMNVPLLVYIPPLSAAGKTYILGSGKTPADYKGDGIVSADSQNLLNLSGRPNFSKTYDLASTKSVYHTEETATGQVLDMTTGLNYLTGWWK